MARRWSLDDRKTVQQRISLRRYRSKAVYACTISQDGIVLRIGIIAVFPRGSDCIGSTVRPELLMRQVQQESLHIHMRRTGPGIRQTHVRSCSPTGNGHG
jgi:hypothetical protein